MAAWTRLCASLGYRILHCERGEPTLWRRGSFPCESGNPTPKSCIWKLFKTHFLVSGLYPPCEWGEELERGRQRGGKVRHEAGSSWAQSGREPQEKGLPVTCFHFAYSSAAHQGEKEEETNNNQSSNNSLKTVLIIFLFLPSYYPTGIVLLSGLGSTACWSCNQQQKLTWLSQNKRFSLTQKKLSIRQLRSGKMTS